MEKPTWLYHRDCLQGGIFDAAGPDFERLKAAGWVDSPQAVETKEKPTVTGKKGAGHGNRS